MNTVHHRRVLLGFAILVMVSVTLLGCIRAGLAENPRSPNSTPQQLVEKVDVNTGVVIALTIPEWQKLGDKDGRCKNPNTGTYTMVPGIACHACGEKIPAYMPDPDASATEVLRGKREHKCPKCANPVMAAGGLSDEDELDVWLECADRSYDKLKDYTTIFYKHERVKGKLLPEERVEFKFKKPFKAYMKWVGKANKGQECLYVKGKYDNKLVARGSGIKSLAVVKLDPKGKTAMSGIRHPITEAGVGHLIDLLTTDRALAAKYGEGKVINKGQAKAKVSKYSKMGKTQNFSCVLPKDKRPEYYCHRAEVAFDLETGLPVSISIYDGADKLLEHYRYENLKVNVGLTDKDFDKDNKDYRL